MLKTGDKVDVARLRICRSGDGPDYQRPTLLFLMRAYRKTSDSLRGNRTRRCDPDQQEAPQRGYNATKYTSARLRRFTPAQLTFGLNRTESARIEWAIREAAGLVSACAFGASEVRAMQEKKPRFPPSLNSVKSEYRKFCEQYGGPIICDERFANIRFESCCREFPCRTFEPTISRCSPTDPIHGIRHWPVMAFAASQYAFRQREFNKYGADASPAHVRELLDGIQKSAQHLSDALDQLQEMSARLSDGTAPQAIGHLSWMDQLIAQAMAGQLSAEVNEELWLVAVDSARSDFLDRLADVEVAARHAQERFDPKLLRRARASENRALRTLVGMAKPIWQSLAKRKPSVNKVGGEREADFVTFVQDLARIAGGPEPSFKQVQTAFRVRTPD